jgi:hypothetical protein
LTYSQFISQKQECKESIKSFGIHENSAQEKEMANQNQVGAKIRGQYSGHGDRSFGPSLGFA